MSAALEALRERLGEPARDAKLNLQSVLQPGTLNEAQVYGTAIAVAANEGQRELLSALSDIAQEKGLTGVVDDGLAAASLMAMNNVYYRFRHIVGKPSYSDKPARLRMNRLVQPATNRTDLELLCLAVSAVNGCETCVKAHEAVVLEGGLSEDHVHDAVRIASVIRAAAVSLRYVG